MIIEINKQKTLTKHTSHKCKCKFDSKKYNSNQIWNNDKCRRECKNPKEHNTRKKDYISNPASYSCENGKYLGNTIDNSLITCDKIIDTTKTVSAKTKQGNL